MKDQTGMVLLPGINPAGGYLTNMTQLLTSAYKFLIAFGTALQSPFLLAVRLYWGWQFFLTGKGKLTSLDKVTEFFASLNIPLPGLNAALAGTTEMLGGLLILVGLASRLTSIPLICVLVVAYLTADFDSLKMIFSEPDKFTAATPFLFLLAMVIVLIFGPGKFSIDHLVAKKFVRENNEPVRALPTTNSVEGKPAQMLDSDVAGRA